jgi:hypothetical protein
MPVELTYVGAMIRLKITASALLALAWISAAEAGGVQPLACSQGNEIRTIDHHMDVNMAQLLEIEDAVMTPEERRAAVEANTAQFVELQERREMLTQECAQQIKKRNEYYQQ